MQAQSTIPSLQGTTLKGISSMAARQVLAELAVAWQALGGEPLALESMGGVRAVQRVQAGEDAFDVVFLASDAIERLQASGHVAAGSKVDLMLSATAVAVPVGHPHPDISTEAALRTAVLDAPSWGYSTGPSGTALQALFTRWGIADRLMGRAVQAAPGVPVAALVADGKAALGFQQWSELLHAPGIEIVGTLPPEIAIDTVFSGAVVAASPNADTARRLLAFMASPAADQTKRQQRMQPIPTGCAWLSSGKTA